MNSPQISCQLGTRSRTRQGVALGAGPEGAYRWGNTFHLGQTQQLVHLTLASDASRRLGCLDVVDNASLVVENIIGEEIRFA